MVGETGRRKNGVFFGRSSYTCVNYQSNERFTGNGVRYDARVIRVIFRCRANRKLISRFVEDASSYGVRRTRTVLSRCLYASERMR